MSERTLKQLVGALVVALGLWIVVSLVSGGGGSIGATGEAATFFQGMSGEAVRVVRFADAQDEVELTRVDGGWRVNGFRADSGTVARFLDALEDMDMGDLAATNPANHPRMGVSADSATTFQVEVGSGTRTLLVGKQGPRFGTAYGRFPEQDQVFVVEGDLRVHAQRRLDDWRDKEILAVDSSLVARIEVVRDGEAYTLQRGDSSWTVDGAGPADAAQVRNILSELSAMIATGFLTEADSIYALPEGGSTIAYSADGEVLATVTIGSGDGERWARRPGDEVVYRLSTFRVGRIAPTRDAIQPD